MPKSTRPRKPQKPASRKPAPLLASLPATQSRKPLDATGCVELTLPFWIALDRLAANTPLAADFQTLLFAVRICLLLKEYGVDLSRADLVILNDAAAVMAILRERFGETGRYWLEGEEKSPVVAMLELAGKQVATAPAVLVIATIQQLLALEKDMDVIPTTLPAR